ncbi:MAG: hypothetical protein GVY18_10375 [Bacteroidetes bacterium]|nr:hypothetical protein [Bacteroidota bacterium]
MASTSAGGTPRHEQVKAVMKTTCGPRESALKDVTAALYRPGALLSSNTRSPPRADRHVLSPRYAHQR